MSQPFGPPPFLRCLQGELERWGVVLIHSTRRYVLGEAELSPAEAEVLSPEEAAVVGASPQCMLGVLARLRRLVAVGRNSMEEYAIEAAHEGLAACLNVLEQAPPQASTGRRGGWGLAGRWAPGARGVATATASRPCSHHE